MVSHVQHTTTNRPAPRVLAGLTAVALLAGTLLVFGVIPAAALMLLALAYVTLVTR